MDASTWGPADWLVIGWLIYVFAPVALHVLAEISGAICILAVKAYDLGKGR